MSWSYTSSPPCVCRGVLWDCFIFIYLYGREVLLCAFWSEEVLTLFPSMTKLILKDSDSVLYLEKHVFELCPSFDVVKKHDVSETVSPSSGKIMGAPSLLGSSKS
jgi:hypothetical protein